MSIKGSHRIKNLSIKEVLNMYICRKNDCWIWTGSKTGNGFPQIMINAKPSSPKRLSYKLFNNKKPPQIIKNSCDNKLCINPKHLLSSKESIKFRFERCFIKDKHTECWNWKLSKSLKGYGVFGIKSGYSRAAHRVSYNLYKGEIIKGMLVCHSCDNRKCVNPDHLWLGTDKDNANDRDKKGRTINPFGENHGKSKITNKLAKLIKIRIKNKEKMIKIAKELNVPYQTIANIKYGTCWNHIKI